MSIQSKNPNPEIIIEEKVSATVTALREEIGILQHIFAILSGAAIRAAESKKAVVVLDYLDDKIIALENSVLEQLKHDAVVEIGVDAQANEPGNLTAVSTNGI